MSQNSRMWMASPKLSLSDLLGKEYTDAVCEARAFVQGINKEAFIAIADEPVDFFPRSFQERMDELVDIVGQHVCSGLPNSAPGAGTASYVRAASNHMAPLTGFGFVRIGEDGKAYLATKAEHYHLSIGHSFPGYRLVENAKKLGIPNATHNNTRGHATRVMEQELIRVINGIKKGDEKGLQQVIDSTEPHVLNRVLNMETGSLAVEAALKMVLSRFYGFSGRFDEPRYAGRTPVVLVVADNAGGAKANYHGTTILTQIMRGAWPGLGDALESGNGVVVRPVRINDIEDFERALTEYDSRPYKVAAFFHEIVLMNYGGVLLKEEYLRRSYELCHEHDVPTVADEIQSCVWSPEYFMFREYGLNPDVVSVGKGFPGGEYPASKVVASAAMDNLDQFGAIVTNGQEELASIAYLVTMAFVGANGDYIHETGNYYETELNTLAKKYPETIDQIEGRRHLSALVFRSGDVASQFVSGVKKGCIDISAQTYKADCLPAALTKIPLISTPKMIDFVIEKMDGVLKTL